MIAYLIVKKFPAFLTVDDHHLLGAGHTKTISCTLISIFISVCTLSNITVANACRAAWDSLSTPAHRLDSYFPLRFTAVTPTFEMFFRLAKTTFDAISSFQTRGVMESPTPINPALIITGIALWLSLSKPSVKRPSTNSASKGIKENGIYASG
jgi:hypothetical protein